MPTCCAWPRDSAEDKDGQCRFDRTPPVNSRDIVLQILEREGDPCSLRRQQERWRVQDLDPLVAQVLLLDPFVLKRQLTQDDAPTLVENRVEELDRVGQSLLPLEFLKLALEQHVGPSGQKNISTSSPMPIPDAPMMKVGITPALSLLQITTIGPLPFSLILSPLLA